MNEPKDFLGIEWGTNYQVLSDMIIYAQAMDGRLKYCVRSNDNKKIGKAPIRSIIYCFFDNRFYEIQVVVDGWTDTLSLLEYLVPVLGSTYEFYDIKEHKLYSWEGNYLEVWCGYHKPSDTTELVYTFKPLKSELRNTKEVPAEELINRKDVVMMDILAKKLGIDTNGLEIDELLQKIGEKLQRYGDEKEML
jgi:hypothetical protein